jgi:predicted ribosomally synthesized peptide with SipW-like signal peptide
MSLWKRRRDPKARRPRSGRLRALLALGTVACLGATGTFAYWSDSVEVSGTEMTSGVLDLQVNNADPLTAFTGLSLSGMYPGTSSAGILTVQNVGTVPLTYTFTSASSNTALTPLTLKVTGDTAVTGDGTLTQTCPGAALSGSGGTIPSAGVSTARTLQPGASETICLQVALGTTSPDSAQGQSTDLAFTFTGNQIP